MKKSLHWQKLLVATKKLKGKIEIVGKVPVNSFRDLSLHYTPGVGAVASYLSCHRGKVKDLTIKHNTVAVVSDGSAVLGLGNIGAEGAIPVMEGKALLFRRFAKIDAFPIVLNTQDALEIIKIVKSIAPVFGGINLEDIAAPKCFEIESALQRALDIPVVHDDQHSTAIVVLAGLINAFRVVRKNMRRSKIVVVGAGAAGSAIVRLLVFYGAKNIIVLDSKGIISRGRKHLDGMKKLLARITNHGQEHGSLIDAIQGADAVIGVSRVHTLTFSHIRRMSPKAIVFALSNPIPEIMPENAKRAGAYIIATGRSDFGNQINNALVFPGMFRGALDHNVRLITHPLQVRAAENLAALIKNPTPSRIIPTVFDKRVVRAVASAIRPFNHFRVRKSH